ncbi:MAG: hypothetical protein QM765_14440 [Myxococcales bacterium]
MAGLAVVVAPGSALACGLCSDAALRRQHWETSVPLALLVALGTEAIAYVAYQVLLQRETGYKRAPVLFMAGFATAIVGFATGASGMLMAATLAVGLLVTLVRSLVEDADFGVVVVVWRVLLVVGVATLMVGRAYPSQVKTPRLVTLAIIAPDSWGEAGKGWVEEQLLVRGLGARSEVEKRIAEVEAKSPAGPRAQDVELFRLHRLLGGELAKRVPLCAKWGVTETHEPTIATLHGRPRPPDGLLSRLCGR